MNIHNKYKKGKETSNIMEEVKIEQITISKIRKVLNVLIDTTKNDEATKPNGNAEDVVHLNNLQDERTEQDNHENYTNINELNNSEEMHDILQKMGQEHWKRWLDESIPALNGLTPNEAARNDKGRELLEELLLSFEVRSNNLESENIFKPDVDELRRKLGLKRISRRK